MAYNVIVLLKLELSKNYAMTSFSVVQGAGNTHLHSTYFLLPAHLSPHFLTFTQTQWLKSGVGDNKGIFAPLK